MTHETLDRPAAPVSDPPELTVAEFLCRLKALNPATPLFENFRNFVDANYSLLARRTTTDAESAASVRSLYFAVAARYPDREAAICVQIGQLVTDFTWAVAGSTGDFLGAAYAAAGFSRVDPEQQFVMSDQHARSLAQLAVPSREELARRVEKGKILVLGDNTCGFGAMAIALAERVRELGLEPSDSMMALVRESSRLCVRGTFVQLAIKAIPALCVYGRPGEEGYEHAYTLEGRRQAIKRAGSLRGSVLDPFSGARPDGAGDCGSMDA